MIYEFPNKRANVNGEFVEEARVAQELKYTISVMKSEDPVIFESAEQICSRMARLAAGDPAFIGHWEDIAGYAILVVSHLKSLQSDA
jgi:hypothetical protein